MARRHTTPHYLPAEMKKKWNATYDEALKQAKVNNPDDEGAQHIVAHKAANRLLAVAAPESAVAIDALPAWQVKERGVKVVDGEEHAYVVTIDGQKYSHPKPKK